MLVLLCMHTNHCHFHLMYFGVWSLEFKCTYFVQKGISTMLCISLHLQFAATCSEKNPKYVRPHAFRRPHVFFLTPAYPSIQYGKLSFSIGYHIFEIYFQCTPYYIQCQLLFHTCHVFHHKSMQKKLAAQHICRLEVK